MNLGPIAEALEHAKFEAQVLEKKLDRLRNFISATEAYLEFDAAAELATPRPSTRAPRKPAPPADAAPGPPCKTCEHPFSKHDPDTGKCWQKVGRGTCLCGEFRS